MGLLRRVEIESSLKGQGGARQSDGKIRKVTSLHTSTNGIVWGGKKEDGGEGAGGVVSWGARTAVRERT